jgi:hypothetical protein
MSGRFLSTVTGRSLGDHVCWPFHGMDDLVVAARGYAVEGLDRHERVSFCKITPTGMQHAVIRESAEVGRPPDADVPVLTPLVAEPGWTPSTSPVATFGRMTQAALADGCTGLRVLTDASDVVRDEGSRPLWVRSEHLMDRHRLDQPLAIVCGYDADVVADEVLAEVACLHALTGGTPCSFSLRAGDGDGRLALSGEVDRAAAGELYHAVVDIAADIAHPVVLDLSEQPFVDHSALVALDRAARALGTTVHLMGASALTACLVDALPLRAVTVVESR